MSEGTALPWGASPTAISRKKILKSGIAIRLEAIASPQQGGLPFGAGAFSHLRRPRGAVAESCGVELQEVKAQDAKEVDLEQVGDLEPVLAAEWKVCRFPVPLGRVGMIGTVGAGLEQVFCMGVLTKCWKADQMGMSCPWPHQMSLEMDVHWPPSGPSARFWGALSLAEHGTDVAKRSVLENLQSQSSCGLLQLHDS